MKSIIEELWYGNIHPMERAIRGDREYDELRKELSERLEALSPMLSEEEWEAVDKILTVFGNMTALSEADAFVRGFRLGARLTAEVMGEVRGQFELI